MPSKREGAEATVEITKRVKKSDSTSNLVYSLGITKDLQEEYEGGNINEIQLNCASQETIQVR